MKFMKGSNDEQRREEKDRRIDIPSEANTTKHISFLDIESDDKTDTTDGGDEGTKERRRQWRTGLEEGRKSNPNNQQ